MILIGQYDSPFVRRVAVTLKTYGLAYEHKPWSTFGDADAIAAYNPLRRVPTLVLDNGEAVVDSLGILFVLDERVGPAAATLARKGDDGLQSLRVSTFAAGVADKAVSLVYERALRETALELWVQRCRTQITETLDYLERLRAARMTDFLFDGRLSHGDVMLGTTARFVIQALGDDLDWSRWPAILAHSDRCEALEVFQAAYQALIPPKKT